MKKLLWSLMLFTSLLVTAYALFAYAALPLGEVVNPQMKANFQAHKFLIYAHVFGAVLALCLGPLQFSTKIRQRYLAFHRWSGRVYLLGGVLIGGLAGLFMAQHAFGGLSTKFGFSASAVVWLSTAAMALFTILRGDIEAHRRWMVRNFALTFSAVTLRIYLALFMASGTPFSEFYPVIAWLSWVPNIILAEWIFNSPAKTTLLSKQRQREADPTLGSAT